MSLPPDDRPVRLLPGPSVARSLAREDAPENAQTARHAIRDAPDVASIVRAFPEPARDPREGD